MAFDIQPYIKTAPNDNYVNFFKRLAMFEQVPEQEWNKNHVLGYFVSKYNNHYNKQYVFKYNTPVPSKCFELFQASKIGINISQDGKIIKKYIDWFFDTKLGDRKITSISAILKEGVMEEFKYRFMKNLLNDTIKRTDVLPMNIYNIVVAFNPAIKTYGDLAFLYASNSNLSMFEDINKIFKLEELKKVI